MDSFSKADQLLVKITPIPGESLLSLVSAAAAANRLWSVRAALELVEAPYTQELLHAAPQFAGPLSHLLGVERSEIAQRMYRLVPARKSKGTRNFYGHTVPTNWISTTKRLAPGPHLQLPSYAGKLRPFHSAVWDIALFDHCPDTGTQLLGRCPRQACGRRLTWSLPNLALCSECETNLSTFDIDQFKSNMPSLRASRLIADLLCPWRDGYLNAPAQLPQNLQSLSRVEQVRLMTLLSDVEYAGMDRPQNHVETQGQRRHMHLPEALAMVEDWPNALYERLDQMIQANPGRGRTGIIGRLGLVFGIMIRRLHKSAMPLKSSKSGASGVLFTALSQYFSKRSDFPIRSDAILGAPIRKLSASAERRHSEFVNITEAKHILGWSFERIRKVAGEFPGVFTYDDGKGSGAAKLLRKSVLLQIKQASSDVLPMTRCRFALGLPIPICQQLANAELLPVVNWQRSLAHNADRKVRNLTVSKAGFQVMLETLLAKAKPFSGQTMTMKKASLTLKASNVEWIHLFRAMLESKIEIYVHPAPGERGLPILFDADQVKAFIKKIQAPLYLSTKQFAEALGVTQRTMAALAEGGFAASLPQRGQKGARMFPAGQLGKLKSEIATTSQVSDKLRIGKEYPANKLTIVMRRHGLKPLVGAGSSLPNANVVWRLSDVDIHKRKITAAVGRSLRN